MADNCKNDSVVNATGCVLLDITRDELEKVKTNVKEVTTSVYKVTSSVSEMTSNIDRLADSTRKLVQSMETQQEQLVGALTGRVPDGMIPMSSHKQIVKGLLWAFTVVVIVAVGAVKLVPSIPGFF